MCLEVFREKSGTFLYSFELFCTMHKLYLLKIEIWRIKKNTNLLFKCLIYVVALFLINGIWHIIFIYMYIIKAHTPKTFGGINDFNNKL